MRVLSVLAVNNQVARAIIRKLHVALWPKRLDTPDLVKLQATFISSKQPVLCQNLSMH